MMPQRAMIRVSGCISGGHHVQDAKFARPLLNGSGISFLDCRPYPPIMARYMSLVLDSAIQYRIFALLFFGREIVDRLVGAGGRAIEVGLD